MSERVNLDGPEHVPSSREALPTQAGDIMGLLSKIKGGDTKPTVDDVKAGEPSIDAALVQYQQEVEQNLSPLQVKPEDYAFVKSGITDKPVGPENVESSGTTETKPASEVDSLKAQVEQLQNTVAFLTGQPVNKAPEAKGGEEQPNAVNAALLQLLLSQNRPEQQQQQQQDTQAAKDEDGKVEIPKFIEESDEDSGYLSVGKANEAIQKAVRWAIGETLKKTPEVAMKQVAEMMYHQSLATKFYSENPDLNGYRPIVGQIVERLESANSGMPKDQILSNAAVIARSVLGLKAPAQKKDEHPAGADAGIASSSRQVRAPSGGSSMNLMQKEIANMLGARVM